MSSDGKVEVLLRVQEGQVLTSAEVRYNVEDTNTSLRTVLNDKQEFIARLSM